MSKKIQNVLYKFVSTGKWTRKSGLIVCKFSDFTYYYLNHLKSEISLKSHPELKNLSKIIESFFDTHIDDRLDSFATTGISQIDTIIKNQSQEQLTGIAQASVLTWTDSKTKKEYLIASSAMEIYTDEPAKIDFVGNLEIGTIKAFTKIRDNYPASPCTLLMICNFIVIKLEQKKMPVKIATLANFGGLKGCSCYMKAATAINFETFVQTKDGNKETILNLLMKKKNLSQLKNISTVKACDYFQGKGQSDFVTMYFVSIS